MAAPHRPRWHPPDEILLDHAAGGGGEAEALIVATHLAACPACRTAVARLERLGGALLDELPPADLAEDVRRAVLARLDAAPAGARAAPTPPSTVPAPLRPYVGDSLEDLPWQPIIPGLDEITLPLPSSEGRRTRLVRLRAGAAVPPHGHAGNVFTLVLRGSFRDDRGRFAPGDLVVTDDAIVHAPVAGSEEDCICLALTEGRPDFRRFAGAAPP